MFQINLVHVIPPLLVEGRPYDLILGLSKEVAVRAALLE